MSSYGATEVGQLQTPLQKAQSAISRDDYMALKPLLALQPNHVGEDVVKETDFVNPAMQENLLHVSCHGGDGGV